MPTKSPYALDCAEINWLDDNTPESVNYHDIYFSRQGLAETRYVFLDGNRLATRWRQLGPATAQTFTIAETGFGTGLNFLAACQLWMQEAPASHRLHYISVEKHPLRAQDLSRALSSWPELARYQKQLLDNYPVLVRGHHSIHLEQGRITLHLLLGDASECLEQLLDTTHSALRKQYGHKVDAWFLDGFTPARNPQLWSDKLFALLAQLSRTGTSYATFTAAGQVRRALAEQGFSVQKQAGFGYKREMIFGEFVQLPESQAGAGQNTGAPWALIPAVANDQQKNVVVIGGGLAGVHCAYAMARRGWQVKLIERHGELAQEASGNEQGMLYTKLSAQAGTLNQFTLSSFLYALRFYKQLAAAGMLAKQQYDFCGLLQLSSDDQVFSQLQAAFAQLPELVNFCSAAKASAIAGIAIGHAASYFPAAGWISPPALCQQLAAHPNIEVLCHSQALSLERDKLHWQVLGADNNTLAECQQVIIATSHDTVNFRQTRHLPLKSIRGQTTTLSSSDALQALRTVVCHEGYLTPAMNGQHTLGATFDNRDTSTRLRSDDHQRNLQSLQQAIPACFPAGLEQLDQSRLGGRVGFRCNTPDYLPLAGAAPNKQQFLSDYAALRKNARSRIDTPGSYYPGLYLNVAHGSRGLCSTPLCAELVAAMICNEPRPMPLKLREALSPARFLVRDLIRNKV